MHFSEIDADRIDGLRDINPAMSRSLSPSRDSLRMNEAMALNHSIQSFNHSRGSVRNYKTNNLPPLHLGRQSLDGGFGIQSDLSNSFEG